MAIEITIPRLGWSMDEGTFVEWLKDDGDVVAPGDPLFCLESDKALEEVESLDAGILARRPDGPERGDTVTVGTVIGYLLAEGETLPAPSDTSASKSSESAASSPEPTSPSPSPSPSPTPVTEEADASPYSPRIAPISPRAARVAKELGVDWTEIRGTGRSGRIRERDVRARCEPETTPEENDRHA